MIDPKLMIKMTAMMRDAENDELHHLTMERGSEALIRDAGHGAGQGHDTGHHHVDGTDDLDPGIDDPSPGLETGRGIGGLGLDLDQGTDEEIRGDVHDQGIVMKYSLVNEL